MFEKILLAVDESSSSSRAVPLAAELAERFHAEIVVVEVPDPDPGVDRSPELSSETLGGAPPLVDRVVMDLKDAGVSARPELWIGPGDEIGAAMAHVVRAEAVDLVVMGEPECDRLPFAGQGLASLPERLRSLTRRPTLLVP